MIIVYILPDSHSYRLYHNNCIAIIRTVNVLIVTIIMILNSWLSSACFRSIINESKHFFMGISIGISASARKIIKLLIINVCSQWALNIVIFIFIISVIMIILFAMMITMDVINIAAVIVVISMIGVSMILLFHVLIYYLLYYDIWQNHNHYHCY